MNCIMIIEINMKFINYQIFFPKLYFQITFLEKN